MDAAARLLGYITRLQATAEDVAVRTFAGLQRLTVA